jgi:hypothetical protein
MPKMMISKYFRPGIVLLAIAVLPSFLMNIGHATSMALGLSFVLATIFCLYTFRVHRRFRSNAMKVISLIMTIVFLVSAVSFVQNDRFDFNRFCQTFAFLFAFLFGANCLKIYVQELTEREIDSGAKAVFYLLMSCMLVTILGFGGIFTPRGFVGKPVLLFIEPSHLAIVFLPYILYLTIIARAKKKVLLILGVFLTSLLIQNATLLLGCILVAAITLPMRTLLFCSCVGLLCSYFIGIDYFLERIDFTALNNISTLAYVSGWERAYLSFLETSGIGVGFQQFGIIGSTGETMNVLNSLGANDLCLLDGASVGPKVIGEFGMLGIICIFVYLFYCAKDARYLSKLSVKESKTVSRHDIFFRSFFVLYIVDVLVRGAAYFSSSSLIFVASLIWIVSQPKHFTSSNALRPAQ